jgi:hypothetical protein
MSGNSLHDGKEIFGAQRESPDSRLRPSHDCTSSPETKGGSAPDPRWSFGLDGSNFGAGNVSSANSFPWQELRWTAYPLKDRKSNGLSGSMADAGCSRQSPIAVRHVSRLTERRPKWDRKHCLMHGEWPPAATLHASGTSCPPAPTRRCADRTRSPVRAGLTNPTEDRCQPVPPLLPPPTAVARAPGRCAVAGWIRRCGRGPCPRQ